MLRPSLSPQSAAFAENAAQIEHSVIERHMAFRDYLRAHPEWPPHNRVLKAGLAQQFREISADMDGRDAFVKAAEREAPRWYRGGGT